MTRRTNRAALTALAALMLTGILAAQNTITPIPPPEGTLAPEFTLAPEMTVEPEVTPEVDMSNAVFADSGEIRFFIPATVATGYSMYLEAADTVDLSVPPAGQAPAHTVISLDNYMPGADEATRALMGMPAEIQVFHTADFAGFTFGEGDSGFPGELAALRRLLSERGELAVESVLPHLPLPAPIQAFHVRERYIDFDGGTGILYLAYYSFSADPILEGQITLVFQGLSSDGATYIAAWLPIDTNYLMEALPENFDYTAFSAGYDGYIQSIRAGLNEQPSMLFDPSLDALHAMFRSISVVR